MNQIQGIEYLSIDDVKSIIRDYVEDTINYCELDAEIIDIQLHGSRLRGTARPDSDLDAVVEYVGSEREDDMFNCLNDEHLVIADIEVDINPIKAEDTGTMAEYMERSKKYDEAILKNYIRQRR